MKIINSLNNSIKKEPKCHFSLSLWKNMGNLKIVLSLIGILILLVGVVYFSPQETITITKIPPIKLNPIIIP